MCAPVLHLTEVLTPWRKMENDSHFNLKTGQLIYPFIFTCFDKAS